MRKMSGRRLALLAGLVLGVLGLVAGGTTSSDATGGKSGKYQYDDVLRYRQFRDILPLEQVLKAVREHIKGDIIETEFDIVDGIPVYEIKYIDPSGRVLEIYVDAKTGKILKKEVD